MPTSEFLFGFTGPDGITRKVAKLQVSVDASGQLKDIYIFQYDAAELMHFSLHYRESSGRQPEYHLRYEQPETIVEEDRPDGPELIDMNVPSVGDLRQGLWGIQAIPFWVRDDIVAYGIMSAKEWEENKEGIALATDIPFGPGNAGIFEIYLVRPGDDARLTRLRDRIGPNLRCWRVIKEVEPWNLGYMKIAVGGGRARAMSGR